MTSCRFAVLLVLACSAPGVFAAECNTSVVSIHDAAPATPYPSRITLSGQTGVILDVAVTIIGFNHSYADDVGIVLVAPSGAALLLQSGATNGPISNVSYTLVDSASTQLPDINPFTSGSYRPAAYYTGKSFAAPGPLLAYNHPGPAGGNSATLASTFAGLNPNGVWSLYVADFSPGDTGSIQGGWCLAVSLDPDYIFADGFETPP